MIIKPLLSMVAVSAAALTLSACGGGGGGGGGSSTPDYATMCYNTSGNTMSVRCLSPSSDSTCSDFGQSSLGNYEDWSSCNSDVDTVLGHWEDGDGVVPGPNRVTSGGGSGSGGSGSGGSGTYPYTYTCPGGYSDPVTIDVPNDSCSSQSERLAYTYGCNLIDDMPRACYNYYTCLGISSSEASATCGY